MAPKIKQLEALAASYFIEENKPFSMQELCAVLDVSFETLTQWEGSEDKRLASFARRAKARVAATWEKGALSAGLCAYLHKAYLFEKPIAEEKPLEITIKVADDGT